eukprot:CAMPEP_0114364016 /NCGR_PEP_ID=MMETSP0101-20121206/27133_1 /TAXON_ID=38822 ORGANISM="Pteridomonas danica, Strain PT" /NCGR_SAMPLE_ID=MMETSP0101 /ASSEMBLY_ACC=CAM_ASM_000211 /LENGTH=109 /DNA_ID=CAMNT_0001511213 /DNA_START=216 /DNA_END=542 /DNA_ORIENTATION=-
MTINDLMIRNGFHAESGGGMLLRAGAGVLLNNCTFVMNEARTGGAVSLVDNSSLTSARTTLAHNIAVDGGGGVHLSNSSSLTMHDSTVIQNNATSSGGGFSIVDKSHLG